MVNNNQLFTLVIQKASGSGTPYTTTVYIFYVFEKAIIDKLNECLKEDDEFYENKTHPGAWSETTIKNIFSTTKDVVEDVRGYVQPYYDNVEIYF